MNKMVININTEKSVSARMSHVQWVLDFKTSTAMFGECRADISIIELHATSNYIGDTTEFDSNSEQTSCFFFAD